MSENSELPASLTHARMPLVPPLHLTDAIAVIFTNGANVGVFHGPDGVFVIDSAFDSDAPDVLEQVRKFGAPTLLINTHWHRDHVGGNACFAQAGIPILAHRNTLKCLSTPQYLGPLDFHIPAEPPIAWPTRTFTGDMELHVNGDIMRLIHLPNAHSDGDLVVMWEAANIILANDFFVPEEDLPFVDLDAGGNFVGYIQAVDRIISMCDSNTQIIPGHVREIATRADLQLFGEKLQSLHDRVARLYTAAVPIDQLRGEHLFSEAYDGGPFKPQLFAQMIWRSIDQRSNACQS
jgi:glyoxylase-like metal-dependent hydrolase (beta-lactamase superfamily II)